METDHSELKADLLEAQETCQVRGEEGERGREGEGEREREKERERERIIVIFFQSQSAELSSTKERLSNALEEKKSLEDNLTSSSQQR